MDGTCFVEWRRDEQVAIEKVRNDLATNRPLVDTSIRGHASGQDILQQKRVDAVEKLWRVTLDLRKGLSAPIALFGVLLPTESDSAFENESIAEFITPVTQKTLLEAIDATERNGSISTSRWRLA
jgi:hypothetical protein